VAEETREGDVYRKLLEKLEQARQALGGQVTERITPMTRVMSCILSLYVLAMWLLCRSRRRQRWHCLP
jgi:hypothetical protein